MKIAVVLNTSWNIYNFRKGLVNALMDKGNQVITIAPKDKYTYKLMDMGCRHIPVKMDSRGANPIKDFLLIIELYWIYKKIRPDIILHYTVKPNIYGTIAANFLGIPVVNNVCGLGTIFLKDNLVSRVAIALYRIAFRFPKKIFFQNEDDKNLFVKRKLASENVSDLLPGSGINIKDFPPGNYQTNNKRFTFLLISRLIYDKGILEYIEAIDRLKKEGIDANFQLLGPIDEKHKRGIPSKTVQQWVEKNQVEYLGRTEDVKSFIENADCIVLPSYREGTPKTLLEAASMAKPIVATDVPGCNNVVKDGKNGYLCKLKDPTDLAHKMKLMFSLNPHSRSEMGNYSLNYVKQNFAENIVIEKYISTIDHIN
ncbi:MAG: glycosyltransferase family 4 protein [Cyclobacteriaceae bacterium]|nr:glycosyltransferase family 4 protein [Cyclobacteriaceae bacterium]